MITIEQHKYSPDAATILFDKQDELTLSISQIEELTDLLIKFMQDYYHDDDT